MGLRQDLGEGKQKLLGCFLPHWGCSGSSERLFLRDPSPRAAPWGAVSCTGSDGSASGVEWGSSSRSGVTPQILQCSHTMELGCREWPGRGLSSSPSAGARGGPAVPSSQDSPGPCCPWVVWTHSKLFPAHKTLLRLFQWLQASWSSPRCQSRLLARSGHTGVRQLLAAPENLLKL